MQMYCTVRQSHWHVLYNETITFRYIYKTITFRFIVQLGNHIQIYFQDNHMQRYCTVRQSHSDIFTKQTHTDTCFVQWSNHIDTYLRDFHLQIYIVQWDNHIHMYCAMRQPHWDIFMRLSHIEVLYNETLRFYVD